MDYLMLILIVAAAAVASVIIGFVWYSPMVFGKIWMKATGLSHGEDKKKKMIKAMFYGFICDFFTAAVFLLLLISLRGANPFVLAVFLWIGFIVPNIVALSLYEGRSWTASLITSSYKLLGLLAMALIFFLV